MAYVNPINPAQWGTARTDQGVDYIPKAANTPVIAIGNATVVYSSTQSGWPGGAFLVYQLNDGPMAGKYVYVAEHLTNLVPVGTQVRAGQQIAAAQPGYPWTEWGWASGNSAGVLTPYNGSPDGTQTDGGKAFARFLISLGATVLQDPGPGPQYPDGSETNTPVQGAGAAANAPGAGVPSITDLPALDKYIKLNYPDDAWLLSEPTVRNTLENAVANHYSPDQIQAMIQQTDWWKHTSQAQVNFDKIQHQTPEELNFADQGSKISAVLANVTHIGQTIGFPVNTVVGRTVALEAMRYGWSDQQIQAKLGSLVSVTASGPGANAGVTSDDPQLLAQLESAAGQYLYNPDQPTLNTYARAIASGTMTMDSFNAFLANQAAAKYPSLAEQIKGGMTPAQIIDPLRTEAANTMEISPGAINFISDPTYAKILNYRPPAVNGAQQAPRVMSTSEMDTYLRGTNAYSYTQGARNNASDLSSAIVKTLGKVAS